MVVAAWHDAVNRGDADALVALSHDEIEVGGPRGSAYGAGVLRDWVARAGIRLEPLRWFQRGEDLVVEEIATWRDPGSGQPTDPATVASVFAVDGGRVRKVIRYDTLDAALSATDPGEANEINPPPN